MIISRACYQFQGVKDGTSPIAYSEDVEIKGGNYMLADIQIDLNQHTLTLTKGNFRGLRINGVVLDPLSPPSGVSAVGGAYDPSYVYQVKTVREDIAAIGAALADWSAAGHKSFEAAAAIIKAEGAGLTEAQFLAFYDADPDGLYAPQKLLQAIQTATGTASYVEVRAWVLARTDAELRGEQTEVVETIGA